MIVFQNEGLLDLHAITTFGASVKEGKNPIGQFGTGLKYAIAVLLRAGCGITIQRGHEHFSFGTKVKAIREKDFSLVYMFQGADDSEGQPCGFTTELGKHWELWMAYREIACNCMDEGGTIGKVDYPVDAEADQTIITVTGEAFEDVWKDRRKYILEGEPHLQIKDNFDILMVPGTEVYYRNVRVWQGEPTLCTYNFTRNVELTEDRTLKNPYMVQHYVEGAVLQSDNEDWIRRCIMAPKNTMEGDFRYSRTTEPSQAFRKVVMEEYRKSHTGPNFGAVTLVRKYEKAAFRPAIKKVTPIQDKTLVKAVNFCKSIGFEVDKYPIHVVETLGESTLAMAMESEIWLSERIFQLGGTKAVASTLIEEFLHLDRGYMDENRQLQQFLFDKIVSMGEEMQGEPL